jgi:ABC-type dipeptide/oligopeptide/nickel transport system permease subunit
MTYIEASAPGLETQDLRPTRSFRVFRRLLRRPIAILAIITIVVIYGAGILAPWVAPYEFTDADFENRFASPSSEHILGTDRLGRDLLSRVIWSAQTTVIISVAAVVTGGLAIGVTAGLLSGYAGGRTDTFIMRAGDAFASVPTILLLLIINVSLLGHVEELFREIEEATGFEGLVSSGAPSYFLVFTALSIFGWVGIARIVRSQVLALRETAYVIAARAAGASTWRILFRHLLPNVSNLLIVAVTISLGAAAGAEVALTWLGIGVQAPHPSFGVMIFEGSGLSNLRNHPQIILIPALFIGALLFSFNLLGDALTDVLSPRRR